MKKYGKTYYNEVLNSLYGLALLNDLVPSI